jgi:hypothetical protein
LVRFGAEYKEDHINNERRFLWSFRMIRHANEEAGREVPFDWLAAPGNLWLLLPPLPPVLLVFLSFSVLALAGL